MKKETPLTLFYTIGTGIRMFPFIEKLKPGILILSMNGIKRSLKPQKMRVSQQFARGSPQELVI